MLFDANRLLESELPPSFDIVIIGGGAAGITLAAEFIDSSKRVCLIESGGFDFEPESQELYGCHEVGVYSGADGGRLRQYGGATNHWGGRCGTLDQLDMSAKSWAPEAVWPITRHELEPFYDRARHYCGFAEPFLSEAEVFGKLPTKLRIGSDKVCPQIWWATPRDGNTGFNFAKRHGSQLHNAKNISVVLHANLLRFACDDVGQTITAAFIKSLSGWEAKIKGRIFILACGGVENSRMLLIGDGKRAIANENDMVGRYFMQHTRATVAEIFPSAKRSELTRLFNPDVFKAGTDPERPRCQIGFQLSPAARTGNELLNASIAFEYKLSQFPAKQAFRAMADEIRNDYYPHHIGEKLYSILTDLNGFDELIEYVKHGRSRMVSIDSARMIVDLEQNPDPDSRILLDDTLDPLGAPRSKIDWKVSELERTTARFTTTAVASELARLGLGRSRLEPWLDADSQDWVDNLQPTFHYLGGTRMSDDPKCGVVDRNCKAHSVGNLYIAGSSVFPSGGHINPTFTIVALATRLAAHLRDRFARR